MTPQSLFSARTVKEKEHSSMCGEDASSHSLLGAVGEKQALVQVLFYWLFSHGFPVRAVLMPDSPKHRWGRCIHSCLHPSRQTRPKAWSVLHWAIDQWLLQHVLPLSHPAARLVAHRFCNFFASSCSRCIKHQCRREAMVLQSSRDHIPLTLTKHIFLLQLYSGLFYCCSAAPLSHMIPSTRY